MHWDMIAYDSCILPMKHLAVENDQNLVALGQNFYKLLHLSFNILDIFYGKMKIDF